MTTETPLPEYVFNSFYRVKEDGDDYLFYSYLRGDDPTPRIRIDNNPQVRFYVETYKDPEVNTKRQTIPLNKVDQYTCRQKDLIPTLSKALGYSGYSKLSKLCESPYVYQANIPSEYLTKSRLNNLAAEHALAHDMPPAINPALLKKGGLDIETSVLGGKEVIVFTVVDHDMNCYVGVYEPFLKGATLDDIQRVVNESFGVGTTDDKVAKYDLKFHFFIGSELDIIKWVFDQLHATTLSAVSIWNMDFDIQYLANRMRHLKVDPKDIFSSPKVPEEYRHYYYRVGKRRPVEHFTEKWSWVDCSAPFFFYDSMCLHSRINKVNGHENSYRLGYITDKYLNETKLKTLEESTHHDMQANRFLEYIAYNIWDAVLLVLFEKKMKQVDSMIQLNGNNPLAIFNKSTVKGTYAYADYCNTVKKEALCAVVGDATTELDEEIPALGGSVLDPNRALGLGVPIIKESPRLSRVHVSESDTDIASAYPNGTIVLNESKDTALHTFVAVNDDPTAVEDFFSHYIQLHENAIYLLEKYFNMPSLSMMGDLYDRSTNGDHKSISI